MWRMKNLWTYYWISMQTNSIGIEVAIKANVIWFDDDL
jgi:hypothetical protein